MVLHVAFRGEGFVAAWLGASEHVLSVMNPQVDRKIRLLCKSFVTAWPCASVGLGALMEHNVRSEAHRTSEGGITALKGTSVHFFAPSTLKSALKGHD